MAKSTKVSHQAPAVSHEGATAEVLRLLHEISATLSEIKEATTTSAYYQQPSRGFEAGIEKAIAQPFMGGKTIAEVSDLKIKSLVREELRRLKKLGDK